MRHNSFFFFSSFKLTLDRLLLAAGGIRPELYRHGVRFALDDRFVELSVSGLREAAALSHDLLGAVLL